MLVLAIGVMVMSVGTVVIVIGASLTQREVHDPRSTFLRVVAASGVMALGSGVLYLLAFNRDGETATDTSAYTALVLSPALMCVALSAAPERFTWTATGFSAAIGLAVAISFTVLAPAEALLALLSALAVTCAVCAILAARSPVLPRTPMRLLAGATGFYSAYCAARVVALLVMGAGSHVVNVVFAFVPSLRAAMITYIVAAAAVTVVFTKSSRAARRRSQTTSVLTIGDWSLVIAAYGPARASQLLEERRAATRVRDPFSVDVKRGVATTLTVPDRSLLNSLTYEYGWRSDETALIVIDSSSA